MSKSSRPKKTPRLRNPPQSLPNGTKQTKIHSECSARRILTGGDDQLNLAHNFRAQPGEREKQAPTDAAFRHAASQ